QEAQYNAFTNVLQHLDPRVVESRLPRSEDEKRTKISGEKSIRRHLWIAATGTQGFLPIGPLPSTDYWLSGGPHTLRIGRPPFSAIILWLLIAAVGAFHASAVLIQARLTTQSRFKRSEDGKTLEGKHKIDWRTVFPPMLKLPLEFDDRNDP